MIAVLHPGRVSGCAATPPSKSIAHRALLCAGLARGLSRVRNLDLSQDVKATLGAVSGIGAKVTVRGSRADIVGKGGLGTLTRPVDCNESGSTLRFLIPLLSLTGQRVEFTGKAQLFQRPLGVYRKIFEEQKLLFACSDRGLTVQGRLAPGSYQIPGNVSSQFITGLMLALPLLEKPSTIRVVPPFESRPYVEMTRRVLQEFGVQVTWDARDENLLHIPAPQYYHNRDWTVEGDYSQAAFFAVLGAVCGGVSVQGLSPDSSQGDRVILDILARCGARFTRQGDTVEFEKSSLTATRIDLAQCPDLGPVLMVLGLFCSGTTEICNAGRLRMKESDRIAAMQQELAKFGAQMRVEEDTVYITGGPLQKPQEPLSGHNDHRVVMSLAAAAVAAGCDVSISGAEAVEKSWPRFFEVLRALGTDVQKTDP